MALWYKAHGRRAGGRAGEEDASQYPLVAQHFERAGEVAQAAEYWKRSGEESARSGNNAEAITSFERALELGVRVVCIIKPSRGSLIS